MLLIVESGGERNPGKSLEYVLACRTPYSMRRVLYGKE